MNLVNFLINKKFVITEIKKRDIIFLEDNYLSLKKKLSNSIILDKNKVYVLPLIISLVDKILYGSKKKIYSLYFKNLIKAFSPKIIVSHELDHRVHDIKKINKNIKTLIYQQSALLDYDQVNITVKSIKNKFYDYFLVWDDLSKKILSKYVKSNFIVSGSLKYNEHIAQHKKCNYDIMFVSEYRNEKKKISTLCQKIALNILNDYAKQNKVKICVALNSIRKEKKDISFEKELKFIKKHAPLAHINKDKTGYMLAAESKMVVFVSSSLGAEVLSSKKKCLGLFIKAKYQKKSKSPYLNKNTNLFFTYSSEKKEIFKKINFLLNISNKKWLRILKSSKISLKYDYKNNIFYNKIYSLQKEFT